MLPAERLEQTEPPEPQQQTADVVHLTAKCGRCKEIKPLSEFHKGHRKNGCSTYCKSCNNEYNRIRTEAAQAKPLPESSRCSVCGETKPGTEFSRGPKKNGLGSVCKPCEKKRNHDRFFDAELVAEREARREAKRIAKLARGVQKSPKRKFSYRWMVKNRYGIELEEARQMLARNLGLCANIACGREISLDARYTDAHKAHIDHDHKTGKVRGILCRECNMTLGTLEKDPNYLRGLYKYLEEYSRNHQCTDEISGRPCEGENK